MQVIAVDVGGSSIKAALMDQRARVLAAARAATPRDDTTGEQVVAEVADLVGRLAASSSEPVGAVGLVVPGIVDEQRGRSVFAGNLGWHDLPLRDLLSVACGLPVAFGHDVRAGGLAEVRLGAARGHRNALVVPVGTGIAAALVIDGQPYAGNGYAGELGHLVVEPGGEPCVCGRRGCLEAIASAAALARRYSARSGEPVRGAADVVERVAAGDPVAQAVWDEGITALARGLDAAITLLDPEIVVLAGGLALAGDRLVREVRDRLAAQLTFQPVPEITTAQLGDEAGCLGAGLLALDLLTQPRFAPDPA
ncbi:MAG TPA: ROK family protein [Segeticoccus sp.]|uniref:ROK family protein n=1 Tax=Segeticoccus sp. TaxID=2706531 RepID=UPI002D7E9816|nr:ROK family protein [Segeticoccus sp.]HET8598711.1 ROK family protein [Segeticoccus sp.]